MNELALLAVTLPNCGRVQKWRCAENHLKT